MSGKGCRMTFLDEFGSIDPENGPARTAVFFRHLRADWRGLFAELRAERPILDLAPFAVVSRWSDVMDALSRPSTFQVTYRPHMDPSVGPFMLARDDSELNWQDKAVMRSLLRWDDLPAIRDFVGRTVAAALAVEGDTVDVVGLASRLAPLRVVQQSFGFYGPDDAAMLRWSRATQADMFHNLTGDPAVKADNVAAGTEMRAWIRRFLARRQPWAEARGEDAVSRLLRLAGTGGAGFDAERVVSNIAGLLVGAVETTSQAIANATEQILLRPDVRAEAVEAARSPDTDRFDAIVWEALRFNPMTTFVLRIAAEPARLAPGTEHEVAVPPGRVVALAIGSAMFDPALFPDPESFKPRARLDYLHMGFGQHRCLGQYVGYAIIPETVRQILRLPGVRLLDGEAGRIDDRGGPFAERFVLGITP
ncbi:Cytochrome P450 [Methylobacterium sp. yr596]|jgi:cytochrome P450|nr:Cytochrome P450 [Methylobacterium sp. yr596]